MLLSTSCFAQFPNFLDGVWKMDDHTFENWNLMQPDHLKGVSYTTHQNQVRILEYLEILKVNEKIILRALVPGQNEGLAIDFTLHQSGSSYIFSNPTHDFPNRIEYHLIDSLSLNVIISGKNSEGFEYQLIKQSQTIGTNIQSNDVLPEFDEKLAQKLGADAYGMKNYFLVILTTGPAKIQDSALVQQHFRNHLDNISRLVKDSLLIIAGPFGKNDLKYRGLFIFQNMETESKLKEVLMSDAAIRAGLLDYLIIPWYGSAALPEYLPFVDRITRSKP
jgi:hypothetical protein